jgi:DNA-binding IclR family transcriptional regulator
MPFKRPPIIRLVRTKTGDNDAARTLSKGFGLLSAFRPGEQYLGNKELAARTGLSKSTVSRLTGVLVQLGYLRYSSAFGLYSLGIQLLALAYPMVMALSIRHTARPFMTSLADEIGGQVSLGMRDGANIVYIESCRSVKHLLTIPEIGATIPIVASAIGRAYLASLSQPEYAKCCAELRAANPIEWTKHKDNVERSIAEMRTLGFTRSFGDIRPEIRSCGVLVRTPTDGDIVVMNCGVPTASLKRGQLERDIGPKLVAAARSIEAACGVPWLHVNSSA